MRKLLYIALTAVLLQACNDSSCLDNTSAVPLMACYDSTGATTITGLTVMGVGVPGDSCLAQDESVDELRLPLRITTTRTQFAISRLVVVDSDSVVLRDTLTIDYQPVAYFASRECGAMYNFTINGLSCTDNTIDSAVLVHQEITNANGAADLRLYFKQPS